MFFTGKKQTDYVVQAMRNYKNVYITYIIIAVA